MFHKLVGFSSLLSTVFFLAACGDKNKVISHSITDVQIEKTIELNEHFLTLTAHVGGPELYFRGDILPVTNPATQKQIGSLLVLNGEGGKNKLRLKINTQQLMNSASLIETQLPNQSPFPISDFESLISVPTGDHSRVYLFKKNSNYTLGLAVVIPEFDILIDQISPSQIIFNLDNQKGVGGFFTAREKNQSGMLIFMPLDNNRRRWKTKNLSDEKTTLLYRQILNWQKKKIKFRIN